jgi:hypothetical protein
MQFLPNLFGSTRVNEITINKSENDKTHHDKQFQAMTKNDNEKT